MSATPDDVLTLIDDVPSMVGAMMTLSAQDYRLVVSGRRIEVDGLVILYWEPIIGAWVAEWMQP